MRRVTELWYEDTLTWTSAPDFVDDDCAVGGCVEGDWCYWDVGAIVQPWLNGSATNFGFQIDNTGHGSTYWKRFVASEETSTGMVPQLKVIYHIPTVTDLTPRFTGTVAWSTPNVQSKFQVDVATDATFTTPVALSGQVASSASSWRIQPNQATPMVDDAVYTYRVRTFDGAWTTYAQGTFTYDAYLRGEESYYDSVPFDLGGGLGLEVGAQNGEARLQRDLFSIPSYGPAGELTPDPQLPRSVGGRRLRGRLVLQPHPVPDIRERLWSCGIAPMAAASRSSNAIGSRLVQARPLRDARPRRERCHTR